MKTDVWGLPFSKFIDNFEIFAFTNLSVPPNATHPKRWVRRIFTQSLINLSKEIIVLKNNFYRIKNIISTKLNSYIVKIELIEDHDIYLGHFPGNPIVPGVCQIQMVKEVISEITNKTSMLHYSKVIKFINIINPFETNSYDMELDLVPTQDNIKVKATLLSEKGIFFKFSGTFVFMAQRETFNEKI